VVALTALGALNDRFAAVGWALRNPWRIDHDDIDRGRYTNVGIINGDGQTSVTETFVLGRKLKAGLAFPARPG